MTKKQMVDRIISPLIWDALSVTYNVNSHFPSEKQLELANKISNGIYELFGDKLTIKDLKEMLGEQNES